MTFVELMRSEASPHGETVQWYRRIWNEALDTACEAVRANCLRIHQFQSRRTCEDCESQICAISRDKVLPTRWSDPGHDECNPT